MWMFSKFVGPNRGCVNSGRAPLAAEVQAQQKQTTSVVRLKEDRLGWRMTWCLAAQHCSAVGMYSAETCHRNSQYENFVVALFQLHMRLYTCINSVEHTVHQLDDCPHTGGRINMSSQSNKFSYKGLTYRQLWIQNLVVFFNKNAFVFEWTRVRVDRRLLLNVGCWAKLWRGGHVEFHGVVWRGKGWFDVAWRA